MKTKITTEAAGFVIDDRNCEVIGVGKTVKEALQSIRGRNILVDININLDLINFEYFQGYLQSSFPVAIDLNDKYFHVEDEGCVLTASRVYAKPATKRLIDAFNDGLIVDGGMWRTNKAGNKTKYNCMDLNANGLRKLAKRGL